VVSDVLILDQFVDSKGHMIPREITGMCKRQHFRMNKLIGMAQKAGIMGLKDKFMHEKVSKPWAKFNTYWDEKTIDIQWHNHEKKKNKWKFQK
jgi:small subunit ribosomal protein S18